MDVANELERVVFCDTEILEDALDRTPVDERLIELAKENKGLIYTCDYNLQKVAETEKIDVLNPNELANELRSEFVPGDSFKIKIVAVGSNPKQGIGYLPEGTMVVVDNASKKVGNEIEAIFEKFIQTNSGRMVFAKIKNSGKTGVVSKKVSRVSKAQPSLRRTRGRGRNSGR